MGSEAGAPERTVMHSPASLPHSRASAPGQVARAAQTDEPSGKAVMSRVGADAIRDELKRALASAPDNQRLVQELTEVLEDGLLPDPVVLRLGRSVVQGSRWLSSVFVPEPASVKPLVAGVASPSVRVRVGEEEAGHEVAHSTQARSCTQ
jgi:hypothetical protein